MVEVVEQAPARTVLARRPRMTGIVARLTGVNVVGAAMGFITGPLLARALGATGRGDLAAVLVPFSLAPAILGLGVAGFAYRELPRGRPFPEVLGSLGLPLVVLGCVAIAIAVPVSDALAGGREVVRTYLVIGFVVMPLVLLARLLLNSLSALERWRSVLATSLTPFAVNCAAVVALYVLGDLTVATAAAAAIAATLLSVIPGLPLLRTGRPIFHVNIARAGFAFGLRSWFGGLAQIGNARLDQFLMITVVAPRELGLYAVAVTIAGASGAATGALTPPLMTRIAAGELHLMAQAVRIMVGSTAALNLLLVLVTPVLLAVLFGSQFSASYPMALILFVAQIPLSGTMVLSSALQADGAPLIPSLAEGLALVITVAGLLVLLRPYGGVGAAIVSVGAYGASFAFQLVMTRRRTGTPIREFVIPTRADLAWARGRVFDVARALRVSA